MAGEVQALAALIQAGPAAGPVDREPVYAMTAASRTAPDWGTTYAEVDLTGQHVYMFQEETWCGMHPASRETYPRITTRPQASTA